MITAFYTHKMVAEASSPSAAKPMAMAVALARELPHDVRLVAPAPVTAADIKLAHAGDFVDDVLAGRRANGFGDTSPEVARSLPYTTGAMLGAARHAMMTGGFAAALCSGFHHAGFQHSAGFCTFNGLMVTSLMLLDEGSAQRVAIIDADQHYGDGTAEILSVLGPEPRIHHYSFGEFFRRPKDAVPYLEALLDQEAVLRGFKPDVILYQAGADAHVANPLGGVFSTAGLRLRDKIMFNMAARNGWPLAWNLAGGYQQEKDGSIPKVIEVHINTFRAALDAQKLREH